MSRFIIIHPDVVQISLDNMWTTVASGILGFSFIFGNSIRGVFESVLTLFVVHPFDVGDTVFIDGAFCVIEEASLTKVHIVPRGARNQRTSIQPSRVALSNRLPF